MRTLPIAIIAAAVTIPVAGYSQDQGLVDSRVGPSLESSAADATRLLHSARTK